MEKNTEEKQPEISSEESFRRTVEKVRPYLHNIKRAWWVLLIFNLLVGACAFYYLKNFVKDYYVASITILPDYGGKSSSLGQFSDLAAMAGVSMPTGSSPSDVYANIINSETILGPVIYNKYKIKDCKDSLNLIYYFKIKPDKKLQGDDARRQMFLATFNRINKDVLTIDVDKKTSILTITAKTGDSKLSQSIVNDVAARLDNYVRTKRKSTAKDQYYYIQKRCRQVKDSLTVLEDKLANFQDYNRLIEQSPELMLEQSRLLRANEIMNTVYIELTKQLELAKIDLIKDTPVLNIKEPANNPVIKDGPARSKTFAIIIVLSLFLSVSCAAFSKSLVKYAKIALME